MTEPAKEKPRIGFIGTGLMGKPMALNLMKHGYSLIAYNRSLPNLDQLRSEGVTIATSPKEVARSSDIVIDMVTDADDVREVILGDDGVIKSGRESLIVIDMSTNSPEVSESISRSLSEKGIDFLDAPVSGGDKGAREGTLTIMVGGKKETFQKCLPVFESIGKSVFYMGRTGSGQATKLANQVAVSVHTLATVEALLIGTSAELDLDLLIKVLSSGAAGSWNITNLGPKIIAKDYEPGFKAAHLHKDLKSIMRMTEKEKITLPGASTVYQLFNAVLAANQGEKGTQVLAKVLEKLTNREIR